MLEEIANADNNKDNEDDTEHITFTTAHNGIGCQQNAVPTNCTVLIENTTLTNNSWIRAYHVPPEKRINPLLLLLNSIVSQSKVRFVLAKKSNTATRFSIFLWYIFESHWCEMACDKCLLISLSFHFYITDKFKGHG